MIKFKEIYKLTSFLKCRIAKEFTIFIITSGIFLSIIISIVYIYTTLNNHILLLKKELNQVEQTVNNSLSENLWLMNFNALNIMLDDLLIDKNIIFVELYDENGNILIRKGHLEKNYIIKKEIPLYHKHSSEKIYIGKLIFLATTKPIYNNLKHSILKSIFFIVIFFTLLSLIIIYLVWNKIAKHLVIIANYAKKFTIEDNYNLSFNELKNYNLKKNELSDLIIAINKMQNKISKSYKEIEYLSLHDPLTGLPNRRMVEQLINNSINECDKQNGYTFLLYIDLDQFKLLNDSLGHTIGDKILIEIANRLKTICSFNCQPARIAGDEFIILHQKSLKTKSEIKRIAFYYANKILNSLSENIIIDDKHYKITASIGITLFNEKSNPEVILKQADNAMYYAKEKGRNNVTLFQPAMQTITDKRLYLEQLLEKAVENNLLSVYYQPKYNSNQCICSAEALVRLRNEKGEIISPADFIPIAEETGLIIKIGNEIIKKVFKLISQNRSIFEKSTINTIAINVSPTQFSTKGFADNVASYAKEFNINPEFIIFEITEEVVAGNINHVLTVMNQLSKYGFKLSLDDFGTGYSSLRYLKNFPLNELKIDKSFVDDIIVDYKVKPVIKTIIDMAHNLELNVVAEGVENKEQFSFLLKNRCEFYQGFLFSKPLIEKDFLLELSSN